MGCHQCGMRHIRAAHVSAGCAMPLAAEELQRVQRTTFIYYSRHWDRRHSLASAVSRYIADSERFINELACDPLR